MVNPRSSWFFTLLCTRAHTHACMHARTDACVWVCTHVPRNLHRKRKVQHHAWCIFVKIYPTFSVYIRLVVTISLRRFPVTSKLSLTPLIILCSPFDVIVRSFVGINYTNNHIKCNGSSSPRLIQVCVFRCTMTNNCDSAPSFGVVFTTIWS